MENISYPFSDMRQSDVGSYDQTKEVSLSPDAPC